MVLVRTLGCAPGDIIHRYQWLLSQKSGSNAVMGLCSMNQKRMA